MRACSNFSPSQRPCRTHVPSGLACPRLTTGRNTARARLRHRSGPTCVVARNRARQRVAGCGGFPSGRETQPCQGSGEHPAPHERRDRDDELTGKGLSRLRVRRRHAGRCGNRHVRPPGRSVSRHWLARRPTRTCWRCSTSTGTSAPARSPRPTRLKFPAPATVETWISDAAGDPVLVVMAATGASLAMELRRLLPDLRRAVGDTRRVLVGFDRGAGPRPSSSTCTPRVLTC